MIGATLFSGIGAPEIAMPEWQWPWHAEIEKFPSAVMAVRHPQSVNLGDVTADDFCERASCIARPDVLVFGSPCQSYSVAGKRLGLDDPRGNLALIALGIVARLAPRWFVFENVPGLLSSSDGRDFGIFLRTVDELRYSLAWTVLDAQHFGVAQRRERMFAVGHSGDWRYPAAVLLEPESLCGHYPPRRQAGKRASPTLNARTRAGGGLGTDHDINGGLITGSLNTSVARGTGQGNETDFLIASHDIAQPLLAKGNSSHRADAESYVAHILNAHGGSGRIDYESETFISHALRADGFDASEDGTGRGTSLVPIAFQSVDFGADASVDLCPTIRRHDPMAIAFSCKDHGADASPLAPTLRAMGHDRSHANAGGQIAVTIADTLVRRLTPRECERLQDFPDDYTLITYRGKPAADGPRYKGLGNSMARPVMRWILSRIEAIEFLTTSEIAA